jgi:glycosyltransferase involved in cell wall biosynthesis
MSSSRLHVGVYGDVNMNLIDGSSVWLQSITSVLALSPDIDVSLLLKAPIKRDLLVAPLRRLANVRIVEPRHVLAAQALTPEQAVAELRSIHEQSGFDIIIIRGFALARALIEDSELAAKTWCYLTDIPQSSAALLRADRRALSEIFRKTRAALCQTEELRSLVESWFLESRGKCLLLPPMIPEQIEARKAPGPAWQAGSPLKLVYAGKYAPMWKTLEMTEVVAELRRAGEPVELHMIGDKVHRSPSDPTYLMRMQEALERGEGVIWHGAQSRERTIELSEACDVALSWRAPELDASLELSTKVLEMGAAGLPVILNRTPMHESLLGADYPLFATSRAEFTELLRRIIRHPAILEAAAGRGRAAAQRFTFSRVHQQLLPHLVREKPRAGASKGGGAKLLVATHDPKFLNFLLDHLARRGDVEVRSDEWQGLERHDPQASERLRDWADIILCEWCAGNAVWYSHHKAPHQKLFVRFHRFEDTTVYPPRVDIARVDGVIVVSDYYKQRLQELYGWPAEKIYVVHNQVDTEQLARPKLAGARFNLGMMGIVPKLKRLDRALDLLEGLRRKDRRFQLHIKTKMPWEYGWIWKRDEERRFYFDCFKRINGASGLRGAVFFEPFGGDVGLWLRRIGLMLSTSDIESFHLAAAEGMASGAPAFIWNWKGAETVYPGAMIHGRTEDMVEHIWSLVSQDRWEECSREMQNFVRSRYDLGKILGEWDRLLEARP